MSTARIHITVCIYESRRENTQIANTDTKTMKVVFSRLSTPTLGPLGFHKGKIFID